MRIVCAAVLAGMLAGRAAQAEIFSPKTTTCGALVRVMKSKDKPSMSAAVQLIVDAIYEADEVAETNGKGSLLDRLTEDEKKKLISSSFLACDGHVDTPARTAAFVAYTVSRNNFIKADAGND